MKNAAEEQIREQVPDRPPSLLQDILLLLIKIFMILTVFVLIFTFIFGIFSAGDMTMKPAIQAGDIVIFYRFTTNYTASDVTILEYEGQRQIRRIAAIAGDTVDITDQGIYINGSYVTDLNMQSIQLYEEGITFPLTVPEGHVFVLGDNRSNAIDSRMYGTVPISDLSGKVTTIIRQRDF